MGHSGSVLARLQRLHPAALSIRARLGLIQFLLLVALGTIAIVAFEGMERASRATALLSTLSDAQRFHLNADMMHDALRADVNAALRVTDNDSAASGAVVTRAREHSRLFEANLTAMANLDLSPELHQDIESTHRRARAYVVAASELVLTATRNHERAVELEDKFNTAFDELESANEIVTQLLVERADEAERAAAAADAAARTLIVISGILTALIAWSVVSVLARSIRRSLRQVSDAARALAAGNLSARSEIASQDEIGELAGAVNKMADDLQVMIDRLVADADRDAFATQLMQALDMADDEADIRGVVGRAMTQAGSTLQMELLLADAASGALQRAVEHPLNGAAGCSVDSVSGCVAVRRGTPVVFDDSNALNACPRLQGRPCGPVSAVCVPIGFMGRSLGVLHAANASRKTPSEQQVALLTALGTQTGNRIGTVRAFERTHMHAYTDALTGLSNRRALEQIIETLGSATPYAVTIADLDHFKRLNDTHGHEAGDRALRMFADVLRRCVRQGDLAARWGGEEFAIVFPRASAAQAAEVVARIRAELADVVLVSNALPVTASFGIADSTMGATFDEILRAADTALYHSKNSGRDRATVGTRSALDAARS
ncbi:MAG TPA: diguanylate cyclase [Steroidobacteraceae bacterium]|nr:diguanylate cyclase [Steroidobacteraceae bacterium]